MKKNMKKILLMAAILCALSLAVMIIALCHPNSETGEFIPPPFEATAQTGIPTVSDDLGWQELDAQAFRVSVCGKIIPNEKTADVWLTNPETNTVWLKLRVLDTEGNILGETGLVKPGEYVQSVTLGNVPKAGTKIALKLMAYAPHTYYSEGAVTLETTIHGG